MYDYTPLRKAPTYGIMKYMIRNSVPNKQAHSNCHSTTHQKSTSNSSYSNYYSFVVTQVGGFIFGIGAKNEIEMTLSTNFTHCKVIRKSTDCDWLRSMLIKNYTGEWVPPLAEERDFSKADAKGIEARVA